MKTWINENDTIWLAEADGATGYSHSKRVTQDLTFKYWDYLAWGTMTCGYESRVLSVGFGGGTFAQLLTRWGTRIHGVGIEVDAELAAETHDWINLRDWSVIVGDFRDVVSNLEKGSFDAVVIDVYDHRGYVKPAYEEPWIHRYLELVRKGGRLLLHCIDPTATLLALNLPIPATVASPLRELLTLRDIAFGAAVEVYIIPLWTTYLVWIGPAPDPISDPLCSPAVAWLDKFLRKRLLPIPALPGDTYSPRSWAPSILGELETAVMQTTFQRMAWLQPLTVQLFDELEKVLRPRAQYSGKDIDDILLNLANLGGRTVLAKHYAVSFLHTLKGDLVAAEKAVEGPPLRFAGWLL